MTVDTNFVAQLILKKLTDRFLGRDVEEVIMNRPGEIVLKMRDGTWAYEEAPELDFDYMWKACKILANINDRQFDAATFPIVSAELPDLPYRFQGVLGSNVRYTERDRKGLAIAIRSSKAPKAVDYAGYGLSNDHSDQEPIDDEMGDEVISEVSKLGNSERIKEAILRGESLIVSGATATGKTTLLNKLLTEIPSDKRIITVEDAREVYPPHKNRVHLVVPRTKGANEVGYKEIIDALMRMTPDWIVAGELSVASAMPVYNLMGKGHPMASTVHAGSARECLEAFANNIAQESGANINREDILDSLARQIGVIVQLENKNGKRQVKEVVFPSKDKKFRESLKK